MKYLFLLFFLFQKIYSVCIEQDCPYKCCIDNDQCNTRPDCLLEDNQFCSFSEDCLSGCCHGKICKKSDICYDYKLITALFLGLFYLVLFLCLSYYLYVRWRKNKLNKKPIGNNRYIFKLMQAHIAKKTGKIPLPGIGQFFEKKQDIKKKESVYSIDDEEPHIMIKESQVPKISEHIKF